MASVILTRTVSAAQDNRIVLSNSRFVRELPIGTTWNKLRIAFRWDIRSTGVNVVGTPRFAVGLCSGSTNVMGDATTTHYIGMRSGAATWTFAAGRYAFGANCWFPIKKVGTTVTQGTSHTATNTSAGNGAAAATADRTVFFVDITKGSPNYTFNVFNSTEPNVADVSETVFLAQAEIEAAVLANHAFRTAQTVAVDEGTDGALDHINFHWNRTLPELEISDIALVRFS